MHIVLLALIALVMPAMPHSFTSHAASGNVCAPQSICGWVRLGRTDAEASTIHDCVNVYQGNPRRPNDGIGNPNLVFSTTLIGVGNRYEIWGKWSNPTSQPQVLGQGLISVTCKPGS